MNYDKDLSLLFSKTKPYVGIIFAFFIISLTFTACNKSCDCDDENNNEINEEHPTLKVKNQNNDKRVITSIQLIGYEFTNLKIEVGDSQDFLLDKGMSGGYSDINIEVSYKYGGYPTASVSKKVDFKSGDITTITLKGCISFEGCTGFYLE